MQAARRISQIIFLGIFILLMVSGKAQFWMGFIFTSIVLAAFLGRFYCGWACPINTLMGPVNILGKKLGTQKATPSSLRKENYRIAVFLLFLVGLGYTIYSITQGNKFPLPLIIIPFGLLVTLFINPTAWHRYLCPWGTFFSLTARFSGDTIKNAGPCNGCKSCEKVCPTGSISFVNKTAKINPTNCLLCFSCSSNCPKDSLKPGFILEREKKAAQCHT